VFQKRRRRLFGLVVHQVFVLARVPTKIVLQKPHGIGQIGIAWSIADTLPRTMAELPVGDRAVDWTAEETVFEDFVRDVV
jgi:hypothetical protein